MHQFTYCHYRIHGDVEAAEYSKRMFLNTRHCDNLGYYSSLLAENNIDLIRVCLRTLNTPVGGLC